VNAVFRVMKDGFATTLFSVSEAGVITFDTGAITTANIGALNVSGNSELTGELLVKDKAEIRGVSGLYTWYNGGFQKLGVSGGNQNIQGSVIADFNGVIGISPLGGLCSMLTNKTGSATVAGKLVHPHTNDLSFETAEADDVDCLGAVLDAGVADGDEAWIVVAGFANVLLKDNTAGTAGNWVAASDEAGYADATNASPAAAPAHFKEIGHCLESISAGGEGTHQMCQIMLHFL